jgi:hypothetical protein
MSELHKAAAVKRGVERTAKVEQRLEEAMCAINRDMQANDGVYPFNGGAVSIAEVVRRAEINESTLYKKDNAALKARITQWLDTLKSKEIVGRMRVRETLQQRNENWKKKYTALMNRQIKTELELQQLQAEHETLRMKYEDLLDQMQISGQSKIAFLPKK